MWCLYSTIWHKHKEQWEGVSPPLLNMDRAIPENSLTTRAELSDRVYVAESAIHGKGIMARRAYVPGDYIGTYWGIYVEDPTPYTLMVEDESNFVRHVEGRNTLRYINHADEPNCELDGIHLFARGAIELDEEITFDYGG